jgi:hypothetical protein
MRQDHETFNGSTHTILYKLGRIEVMAETTQRDLHDHRHETRAGMQVLTQRLDSLEKPSVKERLLDSSGWLTGAIILILALAGKWNELGAFLGASGR